MQIWLYDQRVGDLQSNRSGLTQFVPNPSWIAQNQLPRLGLRFIVNPSPKAGVGLPLWFENLLPERSSELRRYFNQRLGNAKDSSSILLSHLGTDLPGAIRVVGDEVAENPSGSSPTPHRFSLAGMQLKFSMRNVGGRFVQPAADQTGDEWILKHPGELEGLVENELSMMEWARRSKFDVPDTRKVLHNEMEDALFLRDIQSLFAVRRFDRTTLGRVHQEDFAQSLFRSPEDKYVGTYEELVRMVEDACDRETAEEFVRRIIFVVVSGNGDAHLKNWSFVWPEGSLKPRLSPLYDQVCTVAVTGFGYEDPTPHNRNPRSPPELALSLSRVRSFTELNSAAMKEFAMYLRLSPEFLISTARNICDSLPDLPTEVSDALQVHWQRTPWLRSIF